MTRDGSGGLFPPPSPPPPPSPRHLHTAKSKLCASSGDDWSLRRLTMFRGQSCAEKIERSMFVSSGVTSNMLSSPKQGNDRRPLEPLKCAFISLNEALKSIPRYQRVVLLQERNVSKMIPWVLVRVRNLEAPESSKHLSTSILVLACPTPYSSMNRR